MSGKFAASVIMSGIIERCFSLVSGNRIATSAGRFGLRAYPKRTASTMLASDYRRLCRTAYAGEDASAGVCFRSQGRRSIPGSRSLRDGLRHEDGNRRAHISCKT